MTGMFPVIYNIIMENTDYPPNLTTYTTGWGFTNIMLSKTKDGYEMYFDVSLGNINRIVSKIEVRTYDSLEQGMISNSLAWSSLVITHPISSYREFRTCTSTDDKRCLSIHYTILSVVYVRQDISYI